MTEDNLTPRLSRVLKNSKKEAIKIGNDFVGLEHIVIAIIDADRGQAVEVLKKTGIPLDKIREAINKKLSESKKVDITEAAITKEVGAVLVAAKAISEKFNHDYVGTEHVLIAILDGEGSSINAIFKSLGVDTKGVRTQLWEELSSSSKQSMALDKVPAGGQKKSDEDKSSGSEPFIKKFSVDLSEKAAKGEIDTVIGRDDEISRTIHILSRKKKNNPVLVGPAGVGKTSIAEGLAIRIHEKKVPRQLLNKKVFALDMAQVVAGTVYRGQFEERLKKIINEVKANKDFIIFIDEIHTVIGAGSAEGTMDASNILKPALARGEFTCLGATTVEEYRRYIEKDAALERRFQKVKVDEPNLKDTITILKGAAKSYEEFHGVKFTEEVIEAAASLSNRFVTDRTQPDKGIDVLDEAGARVKLAYAGPNQEIKDMEKLMADLHVWRGEAMEKADLEAAANHKTEISRLEHQMAKYKLAEQKKFLTVKMDDINEVISSWTGIPVGDLSVTEKKNLISIEKVLNEAVLGQEDSVQILSKSLKKYRTPLKDPNRPIGNFLFCGPTGVGKTLLAKTIAQKVFGSDKNLLELDMAEYADGIAVTKLVGSSAGYVGYEDSSKLLKHVERNPYSVILFDEIEKAHPDVIQVLLGIMEEGKVTDNHGKTVYFHNTIIILTSNLGVRAAKAMGFATETSYKERVKDNIVVEIKKFFKPEFLNRLQLLIFNPISSQVAKNIVELEIKKLNDRLTDGLVKINYTDKVVDFIIANGFNEEYGARNVRKQIEDHMENVLIDDFLSDKVGENSVILFDVVDNKLTYKIKGKK